MAQEERNYKDNVFCLLLRNKKNILSIYNALNKTNYKNLDDVSVVTLDEAICVSVKNDAAFVLDTRLHLYEQQSTVNPNMPLRNLIYVVKEYQKIIDIKDLYKSKLQHIPEPKFVVFYNGVAKREAVEIFKLSDMYETTSEYPELELKVSIININPGYNDDLLDASESLKGYMTFVNKVRNKQRFRNDIESSVNEAINECIEENVMADFFTNNRDKIASSSIWEFNQELNDLAKFEEGQEDGYERGYVDGEAKGITQGIIALITGLKENGVSYTKIRDTLTSKYDLSEEEINRYMTELMQLK